MERIKLPKEITGLQDFLDYIDLYKQDPNNDIQIKLRRSGYSAYSFSIHRERIHYLKSDGIGTGSFTPKSFNRFFDLYVDKEIKTVTN